MATENIDVFIVCEAASIKPGAAKAFMLARLGEDGKTQPFPIFVVNTANDGFLGYVNACPHKGSLLNSAGGFFSEDRKFLECGMHGAKFQIDTGLCVDGPCPGQSLAPVAIAVIDGDVCLCGVRLAEEGDGPNPFDEEEDDGVPPIVITSD